MGWDKGHLRGHRVMATEWEDGYKVDNWVTFWGPCKYCGREIVKMRTWGRDDTNVWITEEVLESCEGDHFASPQMAFVEGKRYLQ